MPFALRDLPALFATAIGRHQLRRGIDYRLWPLTSRLARAYRRTIVRKTRVIAVVGSFGKSTTTRTVSMVLQTPLHADMLSNSFGAVARAMLRIMPSQRHAVVEVGIARRGEMAQYARVVCPDVAVVTSIGSEHHRSLGSLAVTRDEKAWMVRALPRSGTAVLNGDDANVMWMRRETSARVVTFGFDESCDVRATGFRLDWPQGSRFDVAVFGCERKDVAVRLFGRQMIYPALAAIAVAHLEGRLLEETLARLAGVPPTPGRMEPVAVPNGVTLLRDDFKSPVETMHAALDTFALVPAARRIVLLGDVSEPPSPQRQTYRALGAKAARIATHLIVVSALRDAYTTGARQGGMPKSAIIDGGTTPREAAQALAALLQPGDVVLVKGRDTQMLDRVRLILQGRAVKCNIRFCNLRTLSCETCPMLERGWEGRRVPMQPAPDGEGKAQR